MRVFREKRERHYSRGVGRNKRLKMQAGEYLGKVAFLLRIGMREGIERKVLYSRDW